MWPPNTRKGDIIATIKLTPYQETGRVFFVLAYIYTLSNPITKEVRYVGKTNNPHSRFSAHLTDKQDTKKTAWIRSLEKQGLKPEMEILEEMPHEPDSLWQEAERFYISYFRFLGMRLTNADDGGASGCKRDEETKKKISASNMGKKMSPQSIEKMKATKAANFTPEVRERMRLAQLGKRRTEEQKAALSLSQKGRIQTEETRRRISEAKKGKVTITQAQRDLARETIKRSCHTPEARAKHKEAMRGIVPSRNTIEAARLANKGRVFSEETRAKMRAAKLGRKLSSEHLAKLSQAQKERWAREKNCAS